MTAEQPVTRRNLRKRGPCLTRRISKSFDDGIFVLFTGINRNSQKISKLKLDAEEWQNKHDDAADKIKKLEQEQLEKDNQIQALTRKNEVLEENLEKLEAEVSSHKATAEEATNLKTSNDNYTRKHQALEEELEASDRELKETTAKLRETDVKAETLEKKVTSLEAEKEDLETKLEDLTAKYNAAKAELEEISAQLEAF
ncbi:unnamed protein product [Kuraishia capsulata CBS 1993]|uniref:Tropomyosin n=1 Tax=Kuraishia capsulata CBS 1993 TaxID=1382522 RepID=W6MIP4_9ASCO|nr:uncharacterized protein KUCA_T00001977001 [Kuraishia capsulata CBS 1993]CDK26006.1 unnamed protein product [Kuraishia capsulata CBS 1993]